MGSSVSERNLLNIIKSYYPDAVSQKRFDWLGQQSLDIYIPSKRCGIEYQGEQHYHPVEIYGGKKGYRKQKSMDKKKKYLCRTNDINLYYFSFSENAPSYLHNKKIYKDVRELLRNIKYPWFKKIKIITKWFFIISIIIFLITLYF